MPGTRRSRWVVAVAVCLLTTSGFVARRSPMAGGDTLRAEWPECPHSFDTIRVSKSSANAKLELPEIFTPGPGGLSVSRAITNIPEFHDCQRIVLPNNKFGPLMAVFAAADLRTRMIYEFRDTAGSRGVFAAAEVFNDSSDFSYEPLGIRPLFNCLYLWRVGGTMRAKMHPVGPNEIDCGKVVDPNTLPGTELAVNETLKDLYSSDDYPPVARWDWDARHKEQYIGLRCGRAWCEVGRKEPYVFYPSRAYINPPPAPLTGENRVRAIKGWYDEQFVAEQSGLNVKPGPVLGHFFPDPDLGTRTEADFHRRWVPVSYAAFSGPPGQYKKKFNFDQHTPPPFPLAKMNSLSLCFGTAAGCDVPVALLSESLLTSCGLAALAQSIFDERWWVRINRSGTTGPSEIYKCVTRREHAGFSIPATARWRWLAEDETEWQYCPSGCCEVQAHFL